MTRPLRVGLIGDRSDAVTAHRAIPLALDRAAARLGIEVEGVWLATVELENDAPRWDALWCTPGSPYADTGRVLSMIRAAREARVPFVGTCGGCQHALLEWALDVLGWDDATHAELVDGGRAVIALLACALIEQSQPVRLLPGSRLSALHDGALEIEARYRCSFGVNQAYREGLFGDRLRINAEDESGEVRGFELSDHPFFVAVLFQPERAALEGKRVPLAEGLLAAAARHAFSPGARI
ncbi:CTP synthase C-terminal region-related (seleno)protein [Halotalea alkalilenta]|uniref:CTP synthase C-terminal region-related (seleno)protein n=1 Tax=Halotalea alkalilenta TaxID=376489 RepID=UPI000489D8F2|nr:hypothetical protein [Halotalea alkalilenta]